MSLIKCKECGHEVSDKASACPNCGCPIGNVGIIQEEIIDPEPKKRKGWIWALIVVLLCLIGGGGYYAYTHLVNKHNAENENVDSSNSKEDIVELTPEFAKSLEVYDELAPFSEGYAAVRRGKKWGYINKKGQSTFDYLEKLELNEYNKYVGRWRLDRITDGGQKMRMEVTLKADKSGEFAVFHLKGSSDDVLVYEEYQQCILEDGVIYLTKNGEITGGKTPQLKVGSDGLFSADNQKYVRVSE